jgi:hypothetical protein
MYADLAHVPLDERRVPRVDPLSIFARGRFYLPVTITMIDEKWSWRARMRCGCTEIDVTERCRMVVECEARNARSGSVRLRHEAVRGP